METIQIEKNITMFTSFISKDNANKIVKIAELAKQSDWDLYTNSPRDNKNEWGDRILLINEIDWIKKEIGDTLKIIHKQAEDIANQTLGKNYTLTPITALYRTRTGEKMNSHYDAGLNPSLKAAVVIYLNDNFSGGELYYSNLGISIKPVECSMVLHPGNEIYRHGVSEVTSGTRYVFSAFLMLPPK